MRNLATALDSRGPSIVARLRCKLDQSSDRQSSPPARGEVGSTSVEEVIASLAKVVYRGVGSPAILRTWSDGPQTLETVSERASKRATLADFTHELWASSPERAWEGGTQLGTAGGRHK